MGLEGMPRFVSRCLLCVVLVVMVTISHSIAVNDKLQSNNDQLHNETSVILAIKELHTQLDDNKDGQVDYKESTEFVREEFTTSNLLSGERSQKLHLQDDRISLDELMDKWKESTVYNWSNEDVIEWLVGVVGLPELVTRFRELGICGKELPLIATNSDQLLSQLEVKGKKRRKLQLKAMDIVLFGPLPIPHSYWKDVVMTFSVIFCVIGLSYAWRKHHCANKKIDKFLKEMKIYESELKHLREKFKEETDGENQNKNNKNVSTQSADLTENDVDSANTSSESSLDSTKTTPLKSPDHTQQTPRPLNNVIDMELTQRTEALRMRIWSLENQLETLTTNRLTLRELLCESCSREKKYLDTSKRIAEDEVINAQKMCDKIKRKRATVIGAFRLANSSTLEDAGLLITRAVNKMQKVTNNFDDYHKRWKSIEQLFGLPILNSALSNHTHLDSGEGSSLSDSPRSSLNGGSLKSLRSRSHSNGSFREEVDIILASLPTSQRGSSYDKITSRSHSVNESEMRTSTNGAESLPSWYSAPNTLYRKGSYSELECCGIDGCGLEGVAYEENEYRDSFDSLGIIEEEDGLKFNQTGFETAQNESQKVSETFKSEEANSGVVFRPPKLKKTKSRNKTFN